MKIPPKGSLRTWLWVAFLNGITIEIWLNALYDSGREFDLDALMVWWNRWCAAHAKLVEAGRGGRREQLRKASRAKRGPTLYNRGYPSIYIGWR